MSNLGMTLTHERCVQLWVPCPVLIIIFTFQDLLTILNVNQARDLVSIAFL